MPTVSQCALAVRLTTALALAGCAHDPTAARALGALRPGAIPFRIFPQLRTDGAANPYLGASVPPSAPAPTCAEPAVPDPGWRPLRASTASRYLGALTLRLPARFAVRPAGDVPDREAAEAEGGILIGTWLDTTAGRPSGAFEGVNASAWVGPEPGYPTVGVDTATRQVAAAECGASAPAAGTRVIAFTLAGSRGTRAYLAAVWPVAPARYVRVLASAAGAEDLDVVRRALGAARVDPPSR